MTSSIPGNKRLTYLLAINQENVGKISAKHLSLSEPIKTIWRAQLSQT